MNRNDINKARIVYYRLFSSLFSFNMEEQDFNIILRSVEALKENPIDEESGKALDAIYTYLQKNEYVGLKQESDFIFYNPLTSLVPMTASFYAEGRDDGQKRVEMINFLLKSPFRRDNVKYRENEDHIQFSCLFMTYIIEEELEGKSYAMDLAKNVFISIFNEMMTPFIETIYNHEKSDLYKNVAIVVRSFVDFERVFFDVAPPLVIHHENMAKPNIVLLKDKLPPREMANRNMEEFTSI